ncbi:MAG: hypothetical protein JNK05_07855 [Myxococcales bacterium]|nr:hypothetical protein [Myxococcales bacterium]
MFVRALDGSESTSLALYSHPNSTHVDFSKVEEIADLNPGQLVRSVGGGMSRSILALIDVTGPDGLSPESLRAVLDRIDRSQPSGTRTLEAPSRGVRWHVIAPHQRRTTILLGQLVDELCDFYAASSVSAPAGIEVLVEENEEGLLFSLAEPTKKRLQNQHPDRVIPKTLLINRDTFVAMDMAGRADLGTFASLVTGLDDAELRENNAVIVGKDNKKQFWRAK